VTASLLPLPDDPGIASLLSEKGWPFGTTLSEIPPGTRSQWLTAFEHVLRQHYPSANSASRKLTARHYAPFPLAVGHDVP